jgi:hypothetical protein
METVEFILLFGLITETADMLQPNGWNVFGYNMHHAHTSFPETLLHTTNYKYSKHTKGNRKPHSWNVQSAHLQPVRHCCNGK